MISLEAYRLSIGSFDGTRQLSLKPIYRHLLIGSSISSTGLHRILKPVPFIATALYLCIVLLTSGDIETNPGPVSLHKVIRGTCSGH